MAGHCRDLLNKGECGRRLKEDRKPARYQSKNTNQTWTDNKVVTPGLVLLASQ